MTRTRLFVFALVVVLALAVSAAALASRNPSLSERKAIVAALPAYMRKQPVGCLFLVVKVSNNGKYAEVNPRYLINVHDSKDPCLKYASNGFFALHKSTKGWKVIYNGSDGVPCSLHVPKDLVKNCRP